MFPLSFYLLRIVPCTSIGDDADIASRSKAEGAIQQPVLGSTANDLEVVPVLVHLHDVRCRELLLCGPRLISVCALFGRPLMILLFYCSEGDGPREVVCT